ncbi:MAG: hypothetical protein ACI89J_004110 [Hyphomicrobiaceae bacterium]|jgi:uncharacterized protein YcbX
MSIATTPSVTSIYRYPVKGLTPEALNSVTVEAGNCLPFDRSYAIENGGGRFDPLQPKHLPKINFLMLMRNERMASLRSSFDDTTQTLTIFRDGGQVAQGQLTTPIGRQLIEQFLSSYFAHELRGAPKIVHAQDHTFSDVPVKCLHIVNLASVRELERAAGREIDPLRFRANVYIDGLEPWQEFNWIGKTLEIGTTGLSVFTRTERCDATNVDPATAARDMAIPNLLQRQWGHSDFGIYAKVVANGTISIDDAIITP